MLKKALLVTAALFSLNANAYFDDRYVWQICMDYDAMTYPEMDNCRLNIQQGFHSKGVMIPVSFMDTKDTLVPAALSWMLMTEHEILNSIDDRAATSLPGGIEIGT